MGVVRSEEGRADRVELSTDDRARLRFSSDSIIQVAEINLTLGGILRRLAADHALSEGRTLVEDSDIDAVLAAALAEMTKASGDLNPGE